MIIRCINNKNDTISFNIGQYYVVLEVSYSQDVIYYRIISDDGPAFSHPFLVTLDGGEFEVISGRLPKNWVFKRCEKFEDTFGNPEFEKCSNEQEFFGILGPEKWVNHHLWEDSFWEDWDNSKPEAFKAYAEELEIIKDCEKEFLEKNGLEFTEHGQIVKKFVSHYD